MSNILQSPLKPPLVDPLGSPLGKVELFPNGAFNQGVDPFTGEFGGSVSEVLARLRLTRGASQGVAQAIRTTEVGRTYDISIDMFTGDVAPSGFFVGTAMGSSNLRQMLFAGDGTHTSTFTATTTSTYFWGQVTAGAPGDYVEFDNISVSY